MIQIESLKYNYNQGNPIFLDFNLEIARGESLSILGPSGCGKTTLLYLLAGLHLPTAGRIVIDGQDITRPRPHTGLILQEYGLLPWATIEDNARLGQEIRNFYGPDGTHAPLKEGSEVNVDFWLERLGLDQVRDKYPSQVSGGQRQRTAIARTLALNPDLLLMDEPFGSLDAPTRENLQDLVLKLWQEQALTLVIVTHTIEEAAALGRKVLILKQPPNTSAETIDNPRITDPDFRNSPHFSDLCKSLRGRMDFS
jgi:NitT/TauT family transport system ATP-binding protein